MEKRLIIRPAIAAGLVLLVPLVMTVLDRHEPEGEGWHWSLADFLIMGVLVFSAGLSYEVLARRLDIKLHRVGLALVTLGIVLAIWVELAVGGITQLVSYLCA